MAQEQESYNETYNRVTRNKVKTIYSTNLALGVRILNDQNVDKIIHCDGNQELNRAIFDFFIAAIINNPIPICRFWIEDLKKMIVSSSETFYLQFMDAFEQERSMYKSGAPPLTEIDREILRLLMLNMCHKSFLTQCHENDRIPYIISEMVDSIRNGIKLLKNAIQTIVSYREKNWSKVSQEYFAQIQFWNNQILEINGYTLQLVEIVHENYNIHYYNEIKNEIDGIVEMLIKSILVVDSLPPKIVQRNVNCCSSIRILLSLEKLRTMTQNQLAITFENISIWSYGNEHNENSKKNEMEQPKKSEIKENEHDIRYQVDKYKVKNVDRLRIEMDKKNEIRKTEKKYVLMYRIQFKINDVLHTTSTKSGPFLVIVNQNQKPNARAAVMWDTVLSDCKRSSNAWLSWDNAKILLKSFFETETGCELKERHLVALHEKAIRDKIIDGNNRFSWAASCNKFSRKFSFWGWFFGTMKLVRDHLTELWDDNLVDGFVCQTYLEGTEIGTFGLRFSENVLGGLVIVYVEPDSEVGEFQPYVIDGSKIKDHPLKEKPYVIITAEIRYNTNLKLCNGKPKDLAFEEHFKKLPIINNLDNTGTIYKPRPFLIRSILGSLYDSLRGLHDGATPITPNSQNITRVETSNDNAMDTSNNNLTIQGINPTFDIEDYSLNKYLTGLSMEIGNDMDDSSIPIETPTSTPSSLNVTNTRLSVSDTFENNLFYSFKPNSLH